MKKLEIFLLALVLLGSFFVRLYRFDNPIADWHAWRQADTSAVSRNFVKQGFDILHPRFDDLSNVASGKDNPNGYRFVEFPLYNVAQAGLSMLFSVLSIEEWGRLVTIFSSLLSIFFLFKLMLAHSNKTTAFFTAFFYSFLPFNIYYGRTILPDPSMVMAILGGLYFFDTWLGKQAEKMVFDHNYFISLLFTSIAFLLKPYAVFFILPFLCLVWIKYEKESVKKWQLWLFAIVAISPLMWWRKWMEQYPEGIPVSNWLFNEGNVRIRRSFFYWIFYERLTKLILGYIGLPLFVIGVVGTIRYALKRQQSSWFFLSFLASSLAYIFTMAKGNLQHDYYQILIMPTVTIFLGISCNAIINVRKKITRMIYFLFLCVVTILALSFSWYYVKDYFNINNNAIVIAGKAADKLLPKDAKVIAIYNGDTSFLYQTNRKGWASFEKPIPEMITMGAHYLVLVNPTPNDFSGFGKTYKTVSATKQYLLLDLLHTP